MARRKLSERQGTAFIFSTMKKIEFEKWNASIRKNVGREYGFRQSAYINYVSLSGYFFCLSPSLFNCVRLKVKPLYVDDLWWQILGISDVRMTMSLRGTGGLVLQGQELAAYETITGDWLCYDEESLKEIWHNVFRSAFQEIQDFLEKNPKVDAFIPDETRIMDRDRLFYLMTLLHQGQSEEVLAIIDEAKRNHYISPNRFNSEDGYSYIRRWCEKNK